MRRTLTLRTLLITLGLVAIAVSPARAEPVYVTADQTTYIAICYLCTRAEVNQANPLIVRETSDADLIAYLAFDIPVAPENARLERAELRVLQWRDQYYPYPWAPRVALNYSGADLDLSSLIGPDVPLPESGVAPFLGSTAEDRDHWDITGLIEPLLGERILFVLTPPTGAADRSRYQFEGVHPGGAYEAQPFILLEFVRRTAAAPGSFTKIKGLYADADRRIPLRRVGPRQ